MHGISLMSGGTKYCPKERVSLDVLACYECHYFQKWSDNPTDLPCCWFDYEFQQELRASGEELEY